MTSLGYPERFHSEGALNLVCHLLGWSAPVHAGRILVGATPLGDLAAGEFVLFVLFVSYLSCRLALPISPFFFLLLLEELRPQLQHPTPHSILQAAIFVHLCEMFMWVVPCTSLFRHFFVLVKSGKAKDHLGAYYFQTRSDSVMAYIPTLGGARWENWRADWVVASAEANDRLVLPSDGPTLDRKQWRAKPSLAPKFLPVLDRIKTLATGGLTSMHVVDDFLKRRIAPLQRRARLCCWFTGPNDIVWIQGGPGTDLSWEELELLVKGITSESFVLESLILPQSIPALCDDLGLRTAILATMPTFDESGVAVRQTGGRDPHHGIRIFDASAGGPQPTGVAPSAPATAPSAPAAAPRPLDKGKGAASSSSALGGTGGSEEERRRRLRRADGSFVSDPPRSVRGLLVGTRRLAPRPKARRGTSVHRHHHHRVPRHHNHHHRWVRHRHHHLGVTSPRGTTSSSNDSRSNSSRSNSGRPATRAAGKSRAPSECNPFFPLVYLSCRRVLTHPLLARASSPSAPKAAHPPPDIMSGGSGSQQQASVGSGIGGPSPAAATAPTATAASTTVMPSSTPSAAVEEGPTAPTPVIEGDAGGASSSIPPPTLEEPEVVFGRRLRSGAEPEAAPVPLPRVLSRAHQALHETEAAILWEWEALEVEHQRLSDWCTQLEERTKAVSRQFAFEWSKLEWDCKDYKKDL
jgi:hypothetical protein